MKKFLGLLAVAPFAALAAGESGAATYTGSVAETIVTGVSGTILNFLNNETFRGALVGVLLTALAISVSWVLLSFIKWAAETGFGRYQRD